MGERKLTEKQRKFAEIYAGNSIEAARLAGYTGSYNTLGQAAAANLKDPRIISIIQGRQSRQLRPHIASREQRQAFWTKVLEDENEKMQDRLRASELLGKSEGDFIEKIQHSGEIKTGMSPEQISEMFSDPESKRLGRELALRLSGQSKEKS